MYDFEESTACSSKVEFMLPGPSCSSDMDTGPSSSVSETNSKALAQSFSKPPGQDIGLVLSKVSELSNIQKYQLLTNHWMPESFHEFPSHVEHGRSRSFQHSWLKKYKGLVYSPTLNGGICIYCALFAKNMEAVLVSKPYTKNYHKASSILADHFVGKDGKGKNYHVVAMGHAENFISVVAGSQQPVNVQLNKHAQAKIEQNKEKLKSIVKTVVFCGKQNVPLRGHRDDSQYLSDTKHNSGNFQKLLEFRIDAGDKVLQEHLQTASKCATYRSKTTQNELIHICGEFIRNKIIKEVEQARFYSISADEVADQANHEQLSLVLRFVDAKNDIRTEFMGFLYCESTTGESLANLIVAKLEEWGIPLANCRGQTYDGAGNMSGTHRGVAARILAQNNKAIYTHCASHKLNLAVVKAISLPNARNMMDTADKIVRFYNFSPKRQLNLEDWIEELHGDDRKHTKKLKEMCKTRWVQRHDALNVFVSLFTSIANSLEDIMLHPREWNVTSVSNARSLLAAMTQFQFIAALHTTRAILAYVQHISTSLQSNTKEMISAVTEIERVIRTLEEQRQNVDHFHQDLYKAMVATATSVNVQPAAPRIVNRQRHRTNAPAENVEEYYKRNVCIPMMDEIIQALKDRFGQQQMDCIKAFKIIPSIIKGSDRHEVETNVLAFSGTHRDDLPSPDNMKAELHIWINRWSGQDMENPPQTAAAALNVTDQAFFPNIYTLLKLLCTTGVTSCECERSISALRRLETYLRTTMSQDRINGLALMHVHYDIDIEIDWVINEFAQRNPRRMQLTNILAE